MDDAEETLMPAATLARRARNRTTVGSRLLALARRHSLALGLVLLACALGQVVTFAQNPRLVVDPDGPSYLNAAHAILTQHQFLNPERTPGYPIFLAIIFSISGEHNLVAITFAQAAMTVIATLEIFALVYLVSHRRWVACVLAALIGANLYILDWERLVRDETLSFLIAVTLFLTLTVYVRTERRSVLAVFTIVCLVAVLTRPAEVFLPALVIILLALRSLRIGRLRSHWRSLGLSLIMIYVLLLGYMGANATAFGFFGLTNVMNINLFGKVLEYRMQDESAAPQYAQLRAEADNYVRTVSPPGSTGALSPWAFLYKPWGGSQTDIYARDNYASLGAYSKDIIFHHPVQYTLGTVPDVLAGLYAAPSLFYAPYKFTPSWILRLLSLGRAELETYQLLPIALLLLTALVWRAPRDDRAFVLWVMLLAVAATLIVNAVASYAEFYRLREPLDWAVIVAVGLLAIDALTFAANRLRSVIAGSAGSAIAQAPSARTLSQKTAQPVRDSALSSGLPATLPRVTALSPGARATPPTTALAASQAGAQGACGYPRRHHGRRTSRADRRL